MYRHDLGTRTLCGEDPDVYCRYPTDTEAVRQIIYCYYDRYVAECRNRFGSWTTNVDVHVGTRGARGFFRRVEKWYSTMKTRIQLALELLMNGVEPNPGPRNEARCVTADLSDGQEFLPKEECPNQGLDFYFSRRQLEAEHPSTDDVEVFRQGKKNGKKGKVLFDCKLCGFKFVPKMSETKIKLSHSHAEAAPVPDPVAPPVTPEFCDTDHPGASLEPSALSRPQTPVPQSHRPVDVGLVRESLAAMKAAMDDDSSTAGVSVSIGSSSESGGSPHRRVASGCTTPSRPSTPSVVASVPEEPPRRKALTGIIIGDRDLIRVARSSSWLLASFPLFAVDVKTRLRTIPYLGDDRLVTLRGVKVVPQAFDAVYCAVSVPVSTVAVSFILTSVVTLAVHWLPGVALLGYTAALVSLSVSPVRFGYVPHLASCALVEFSHAYRADEIRAAVHLRLSRVACFPLRDEHSVGLLRGTEHVVCHLMKSERYFYDEGEPLLGEERDTDSWAAVLVPALLATIAILFALAERFMPSEPVFPSSL